MGDTWTNQVTTRVNFCHVACHVGLNSTSTNQRLTRVICATWQSGPCARRTFPGCCGNPPTHPHPPTTHHLPGCFWEVPRVFGGSTGVLGRSRTFRVFLGSSGCVWEVPGMFGKFPRCVWEVPGVFGKCPGCFGKFRYVFGSSRCFRKLSSFGTQKTRFAILRLQKQQIQSKNS